METILYKRLDQRAIPPRRAHDGDAGWDICAIAREMDLETGAIVYHTGLAFAVPRGMWLDARARSSIYKTGLCLCNGVGTIDSGYRGEVMACFYNATGNAPAFFKPYHVGDRILQIIPMPIRCDEVEFREVEKLPPPWDGRGAAGFGSTGRD